MVQHRCHGLSISTHLMPVFQVSMIFPDNNVCTASEEGHVKKMRKVPPATRIYSESKIFGEYTENPEDFW